MARTFKVLSALLSYPTEELRDAAPELKAAVAGERLLPAHAMAPVFALIDVIAAADLYDAQERYVLLFDRTRSLSLHLFEHVHGESRERGQALVDLMAMYERHGLEVSAHELPDYLPLFLEFLSTLPTAEARDLLAQPLHIIAALGERLSRRDSVYAGVFQSLVALAKERPAEEALKPLREAPVDDPDDLAALDAVWAEEPVTFGPAAPGTGGGCGGIADMLRRMGADLTPRDRRPAGAARQDSRGVPDHD
jgi:nitrate reductase delta subunit